VVKVGEDIASGAVGTRVDGADIPVTIDDRFHLGSDTKAMTATLAGMMVDEGRLRWDSIVGEVLGKDIQGMNPKLAAVTLEQLLSHSFIFRKYNASGLVSRIRNANRDRGNI
jgi:CubicO group peptidase (beta-lactamase class C family)